MQEQLSLFDNEHVYKIQIGDTVKVQWNDEDIDYIKKSFPQLLTIGVVKREKLDSYDVTFGDTTSYLIDNKMIVKY